MTTTEAAPAATTKDTVYDLKGTLLEACSCGVLCPCWIGEDPDEGSCLAVLAYNFTDGLISGVDVSGLTLVHVVHIPGNVLTPNSWRIITYVDDRADDEQLQALIDAYHGRLGGPLADLAGLVGEVVAVERAPIEHRLEGGHGTLHVGELVHAEMEPYTGPGGTVTTLRDSIFSTVPGSPAWVAKASTHRVNVPQHGMTWEFEGRNAIQSDYHITFAG